MPAPRKLLESALNTLSEKTLRKMAEHMDIRNRNSLSKGELCRKFSRDDMYLIGYCSSFTVAELKGIAVALGTETKALKKDDLHRAVSGFIHEYDKINRKLTYEDVFDDPQHKDFGARLRDWMAARESTMKSAALSAGERTLRQIRYMIMDINGNSFPGFFESGVDDRPEATIQALQAIGAKRSAAALLRIGQILFNSDTIPKSRQGREDAMYVEDDEEADAFSANVVNCDKIWQKTGEDLALLSQRFAAKNPSLFR